MYTRVQPKKIYDTLNAEKPKSAPIQIPENYSGNAFTADGYKITPEHTQFEDFEENKKPHLSPSVTPSIPVVTSPLGLSDYPTNEIKEPEIKEDFQEEFEEKSEEDAVEYTENNVFPQKPSQASLFSALLPDGIFKNNFPFGHGLGVEELLILGIMLSIYLSGEADGELMILLGILLFAG